MPEVACVGVTCVDVLAKTVCKIPKRGKLETVETLQLQVGGCATNAAIALSRLGITSALIGKIGNDGFGKHLLEVLQEEGVNTEGLAIDPHAQTSASVVLIDYSGERSILHCLGTNTLFTYEDVNLALVRSSKVLFIAGALLLPRFDGEGATKLSRFARDAGLLICMDTAWDWSGQWFWKIRDTLPYVHWFMPSFEEAKELSDHSDPESMARFFIAQGVENVVIKLGEEGCYVHSTADRASFFVPAYRVEQVVDTSGAGDAFCAGFIAGLIEGLTTYQCAQLANAVAAHCIMEIGTTAGIKRKEEILNFMKTCPTISSSG